MKKPPIFSSLRYKMFMLIMVLMGLLAIAVSMVAYHYTNSVTYSTVEEENINAAIQMQRTTDVIFRQSLTTNGYAFLTVPAQIYMDADGKADITDALCDQLREHVSQYYYTQKYIYSVGFYAKGVDALCIIKGKDLMNVDIAGNYEDQGVYEFLATLKPYELGYYPHAYRGRYPYVLTIAKMNRTGNGATFLTVNMAKMKDFVPDEEFTDFFIVSEDGTVIFSNTQSEMGTNAKDIAMLSDWTASAQHLWTASDGKKKFLASVKSEHFDWYYVAVRDTTDIHIPLNAIGAVWGLAGICLTMGLVYSIVISRRTVKPLDEVMDMLDDKSIWTDRYTNEETRRIAQKLASILASNRDLQSALEDTLQDFNNLQNTALQYQINPHFLYNTLNTISMITAAEFGPRHDTVAMISKLSQILRYSLQIDTDLVPLAKELEYVRLYIDILKRRHHGIIDVVYDIPESLCNAQALRLSLQPLVENAVYHGIQPKGGGTLTIGARTHRDTLILWVSDDGVGMTELEIMELNAHIHEKQLHSEHIGLSNIHKRLQILFGDDYGVVVTSEEGQSIKASMMLPYVKNKAAEDVATQPG